MIFIVGDVTGYIDDHVNLENITKKQLSSAKLCSKSFALNVGRNKWLNQLIRISFLSANV